MHLLGKYALTSEPIARHSSGKTIPPGLWLDDLAHLTVSETDDVFFAYDGTVFSPSLDVLLGDRSALDDVYGAFTYAYVDHRSREVQLGTDRLGLSPLYYTTQNGSLIFGSSLTRVRFHLDTVEPDYDAVDELLCLGFIMGEKSSVKGISRLAPGTKILIRDNEIKFERYWEPELPDELSPDKYIDQNNELLDEALTRSSSAQGKRVVLMSGGEDSRRIGTAVKASDLNISFATQEAIHAGNVEIDVRIAQLVARQFGYPILVEYIPSTEVWHRDTLFRDFWMGFETYQHEWILPLLRRIAPGSIFYDGILGGPLINGGFIRKYPEWIDAGLDADKLAGAINRRIHTLPLPANLVSVPIFERLRDQINKLPPSRHRATMFMVLNQQRRSTALQSQLYRLMDHQVCYPFSYYPLFKHSFAVDPTEHLERRFQYECIKRLDPNAVTIPSTRDPIQPDLSRDLSAEQRRRAIYLVRTGDVSSAALELLPQFRRRLPVMRAAARLRLVDISIRWRWWHDPLLRLTRYLKWIEGDTDEPLAVCD